MPNKPLTLITGASSGIGLDFARRFAIEGHDLILVARSRDKLQEAAYTLQVRHRVSVNIIVKDLTKIGAAQNIFNGLKKRGIKVEILINNAGYAYHGEAIDCDAQWQDGMIDLNIKALTQMTTLFGKDMAERGGGKIMNIASIVSYSPVPMFAVYSASKAYVLSFSEAIAAELKPRGVHVMALCPGATRSQFAETAGMSRSLAFRFNVSDSAKVAKTGYQALMGGRRNKQVGILNRILIFSGRLVPRRLATQVGKLLMAGEAK